MEEHFKKGSVKSFDIKEKRPETLYNHWSKGAPRNQIQLAFSQHYDLFKRIINKEGKLKVLEVVWKRKLKFLLCRRRARLFFVRHV